MLSKVISSLIISFILISCPVNSQNHQEYRGSSITDFTIHKVLPQKTIQQENTDFKADIQTEKSPKNTLPIRKVKVAREKNTTKNVVQKPSKPQKKQEIISKKTTKIKPADLNKNNALNAVKSEASPGLVREIETTDDEFTEKMLSEEHEKILSFDKNKYTENLNKLLDNEKLADDSFEEKSKNTLNSYDYIIKPSISLGIVLLLMFALAWLYSRWKGVNSDNNFFGNLGNSEVNRFKILASSALGQGKIIQLVEINGKQLVIGSTNNNINLLTEISPEEMDDLMTKAEINKRRKKKTETAAEEESEHYDPESYSSRYSDLYKEYTRKKED